jgi:hypothetical protein
VNIKEAIISQYLAALAMLQQVIVACPDALWDDPAYRNRTWQIAYHALFYTHLYVQPSLREFVPWSQHRTDLQNMGDSTAATQTLSKTALLEYIDLVQAEIVARTAALDLDAASGFDWIPLRKFELQFYTIRHLQQHTGELCERLNTAGGLDVDWVGAKTADA